MTIADLTLTAFTLCNSLRVVAYLPQIAKAARDHCGAQAISFGTWGLFLVSHASATAYAIVNKEDWTMASVFLGNAIGCGAIVLITAWKRSRHRRRQTGETAEGGTNRSTSHEKRELGDRDKHGAVMSSSPVLG